MRLERLLGEPGAFMSLEAMESFLRARGITGRRRGKATAAATFS